MFQDNLKTLCKNKGITQEKLAARLMGCPLDNFKVGESLIGA